MQKTIAILEVSRKQEYIFGSKKLKENARRSAEIAYVTSNSFFERAAGSELYQEKNNFVYSGGGHTVLVFDTREAAWAFVRKVTETAMREFAGLEMFAKLVGPEEYKDCHTPGEILKELSKQLEQKKSRRKEAFRYTAFGIEALDSENYTPVALDRTSRKNLNIKLLDPPEGWYFPEDFKDLVYDTYEEKQMSRDDNFLAVIHIDGNAMGARVDKIYQKEKESWEGCCKSLREFSTKIQHDFEQAFLEMVQELLKQNLSSNILPVRPVILAGDDVCFVTAGCIGLECARIFLEKLSEKEINGENYSACAGVAMVHRKYPFYLAYDLAEELCSSAKKFGAALDGKSRISAMDWHIEFGQLKDNLEEVRKEYITEDGNHLELRPVVVVNPDNCAVSAVSEYDYFKTMCKVLQDKKDSIARSKMKEWRTALKQGEVETEYFIRTREIEDVLYKGFDAEFRTETEKKEEYEKILKGEKSGRVEAFREVQGIKHNVFFDAIEMMDHAVFF